MMFLNFFHSFDFKNIFLLHAYIYKQMSIHFESWIFGSRFGLIFTVEVFLRVHLSQFSSLNNGIKRLGSASRGIFTGAKQKIGEQIPWQLLGQA